MKRPLIAISAIALLASAHAQTNKPAIPIPSPTNAVVPAKTDYSKIFKSDKERDSYAIGLNVAGNLKKQLTSSGAEIDLDGLLKAMHDVLTSSTPLINEMQEREILTDFSRDLRAKAEAKHKLEMEKNKAEGKAFLDKNKTVPGVVTLPDGLQYQVITAGTGNSPKAEDEVSVNYRGTLINGTEFDNSSKHGQAFTTKVAGGIITGWTEALKLMKVGAKWRLFIPSDLAYGNRGAGAMIPPDAALIFEIELLSIKQANPPQAVVTPPPASSTPLTSDIIRVPSAEEMKKGKKIETIKAEDVNKAAANP